MTIPDIAELINRWSSKATYGGGSVAFVGGLSANELAAVGGLVIGVAGLIINVVFKILHYQLARQRAIKRIVYADEDTSRPALL
jgi:hypothetical protein